MRIFSPSGFRLAGAVAAVVTIGCHGVAVAGAATPCEALGGTVDGSQSCQVHAATPAYALDISFPADYPDPQPVADYLTQQRDGFVSVAEMPGSRGLPYEMDVTGTSYASGAVLQAGAAPTEEAEPQGTRSIALELFQDVGGAHPMTWYKTFNYDLAQKAPITYDTLFKPGSKPLEVIFPIVASELARQTGLATAISAGDGMDPSHYQDFAITDTDVIFFFGQGELLAEDAGANSVTVPRQAIAALLA